MTAVELRNRLATLIDLRFPVTLIFDHPTPDSLAARLLEEIVNGTGAVGFEEQDAADVAVGSEASVGVGLGSQESAAGVDVSVAGDPIGLR